MRVTNATGQLIIGATEVAEVPIDGEDVTLIDPYAPVVDEAGREVGRVLAVHADAGGLHATLELHHMRLTWQSGVYALSVDPAADSHPVR